MAPVEKGSPHQEQIRILTHQAASIEKIEGKPNDLILWIRSSKCARLPGKDVTLIESTSVLFKDQIYRRPSLAKVVA